MVINLAIGLVLTYGLDFPLSDHGHGDNNVHICVWKR